MRPVVATLSALSLGLVTACAGGVRSAGDAASAEGACAGLPSATVDRSVADLRANVESVEPLRDDPGPKAIPHLIGAVVQVRATPGMTAQWLGRVLACDAERHAAAPSCADERCPLAPAGASSEVTSTPTGFAVAVRSRDPDVAHQIERRARAFVR
jgi:hypothetical protein